MSQESTPQQKRNALIMVAAATIIQVIGQLLIKAAEQLFEDDAHFRAAVQKGIEQADHGEFVDETEMDARVSRLLGR